MEQLKAVEFIEKNKDFLFPNKEYSDDMIEELLIAAPDFFELTMNAIPFRKPSTIQLMSFFVGSLGVDRFYFGEISKGIIKYITFGGAGIWWIADIISAKERCRAYNCKKLIDALNDPSVVANMQKNSVDINKAIQIAKVAAPVIKTAKDGIKSIQDTMYVD